MIASRDTNGQKPRDIRILLHDIRSAHNVGSIWRTSDAAGVTLLYLSGYTPRPVDRFGRPVKELAKTALGAEHLVPSEDVSDPTALITHLKGEGFAIVGLEIDPRAIDYRSYAAPQKALLIPGREVEGLAEEFRAACDTLIEIPMMGQKESLNVSVATGIALFRLIEG